MAGQFACDTGWTFTGGKIINRANVVQTTAGDIVAAGSVRASHDP